MSQVERLCAMGVGCKVRVLTVETIGEEREGGKERRREGERVAIFALPHTLMPLSFSCSSLVVKGGAVPDEGLSCMDIPALLPATAAVTPNLLLLLLLLFSTAASILCCCLYSLQLLHARGTNAPVVTIVDATTTIKVTTSRKRGMLESWM